MSLPYPADECATVFAWVVLGPWAQGLFPSLPFEPIVAWFMLLHAVVHFPGAWR